MTWFAICLILAALGLAYVYYAGCRQKTVRSGAET